jgi:hypothetical protein
LMTTIEPFNPLSAQPPLWATAMWVWYCAGCGCGLAQGGDRVVSNVRMPMWLRLKTCAPSSCDTVDDESAAFVVVASIIRKASAWRNPRRARPCGHRCGPDWPADSSCCARRAAACWPLILTSPSWHWRHLARKTCNPGAGEGPVAAGMALSCGQGCRRSHHHRVHQVQRPSGPSSLQASGGRIVLVVGDGAELNRA